MDELIDVYDENRERTGRSVPRFGHPLKPGEYMLYVTAICEDLQGRLLITQRALDRHWGAGWWEVTGGGVPAGEDSAAAVVREVAEEVGLDVAGLDAAPVYSYRNDDPDGDNYFMDIYHFTFDFCADDVSLQESEAIDFRLATWDEVRELAEQGVFLHYSRLEKALEAEGRL